MTSTSTIVELSRHSSTEKVSQATWKNHLKSSVIIEEGDQILLKNVFVDTTNLSSSNIIIEKDINCHIEFGFYVNNIGIEMIGIRPQPGEGDWGWALGSGQTDNLNPDGLPYVCKLAPTTIPNPTVVDNSLPYIDYADFTIPAGIYSKTYLGQYISRKLQGLNTAPITAPALILNHTTQTSKDEPSPPYPVIESVFQSLFLVNINGGGPLYEGQSGEGDISTPGGAHGANLIYFTKFLSDIPKGNDVTSTGYWNDYVFPQVRGYNQTNPENNKTFTNYDGGYVGCPNIALTYNADSQLYQFDYLHNPIIDNNGNQTTAIANVVLGTRGNPQINPVRTIFMNSRSGLMLTKLEPVDFWTTTLGFNLDQILFDPTNNFTDITLAEFNAKTTQNIQTIQSLIQGPNIKVLGTDYEVKSMQSIIPDRPSGTSPQVWFNDSNVTSPIVAGNTSKGTIISGGHFLIDVKGYNTEYKYELGNAQYKGLVSAFFVSPDSFVCGVGPDSSFYQHKGSPLILNSFELSIINPITHKEATNLGDNSSVYLQVIKNEKPKTEDAKK